MSHIDYSDFEKKLMAGGMSKVAAYWFNQLLERNDRLEKRISRLEHDFGIM